MNSENQSHFEDGNQNADDAREDRQFVQMMGWLAADAAPPDRSILTQIRNAATDVFIASKDSAAVKIRALPTPPTSQLDSRARPSALHTFRKRPMIVFLTRFATAALAASILIGTTYLAVESSKLDGPTLGEVFNEMNQAQSFHFQVTTADRKVEIWGKQDGRARIDHGDGIYTIAHGPRLWSIDEPANLLTPGNTPFFDSSQGTFDIFQLFLTAAITQEKVTVEKILKAQPVERLKRTNGEELLVYRENARIGDGPHRQDLEFEALVDAKSNALQSIVATERLPNASTPSDPATHSKRIELTVVDLGGPVDNDLFWVSDTLTTDGRVGKVTDVQGLVTVRPIMARRWTPIRRQFIVRPGDWIRTDLRGANAATIQLIKNGTLTIGPGTTIEIINPREVRVLEGELQIDPRETSAKESLLLIGPQEQKIPIRQKQFYRRIQDQLVRIEKSPEWLQGYEGTAVVHSIGSLVAKVDGRDVPLSVGYYHVSVDIRDQIARTTIEQSFVNHTPTQTEGVFYFPLPQDASISGFGMWIGNELIEADIVEKQRAREIYETILRERRDPALLEWSGGNLFKARVFPIPANSEKRIKIIYTQVLPFKGGEYRYQYALQSELLKQKPLRDLCIDVTIHSALPIQEVRSPTHSVRSDHTRNSAHVEFSAQEYSPESDFEIVVALEERSADVVMIPHQRGEDGYFLLQLTPPAPSGQWRREVLGDSDPIELLILADTSASLDTESRKKQEKVIAALLASLGSGDTFNLAVCDVDCEWIFEAPRGVTEQNITEVRTVLDKRASLGWTDLDKAFMSAQDQCGPATHVIYIGDGIVTTGQADPVACADRIRRHYEKKPAGTFHAITVSNTYEPALLRSIAALGGGSFRQVSGEATPESVATELLGEISQPTIRNLKIEFRNLRVARVYPDPLPNLAAGTQQIVLGRYLPEGKDQQGEVIVTGTRGGKPIQFSTNVSLEDAEQGNSFIPRLWARMHLDALMQQGASEAIQQEIIALSEQYHIITPYTSLLVLESDADRERFKVTRRFQMLDGEKFFAEGRDTADYQLVQQQMRRAGLWRAGLRQRVLMQFAQMGRDIRRFVPQQDEFNWRFADHEKYPLGRMGDPAQYGLVSGGQFGQAGAWYLGYERGDGSGPTNWFLQDGLVRTSSLSTFAPSSTESATPAMAYDMKKLGEMKSPRAGPADEPFFLFDDFSKSEDPLLYSMEGSSRKRNAKWDLYEYEGQPITAGSTRVLQSFGTRDVLAGDYDANFVNGPFTKYEHSLKPLSLGLMPPISQIVAGSRPASRYRGTFLSHFPDSTSWFDPLFPSVPHPAESVDLIQEPKSSWPLEAVTLSQSLLRKETLLALDGGLEIRQTSEYFNPRWDRTTLRSGRLEIYTPKSWLFQPWNLYEHSIVQWCRGTERGTLSEAFLLGRIRKAMPSDFAPSELQLGGFPLIQKPLHLIYPGYQATMEPLENHTVRIILQHPANPAEQIRLKINTQFNALVSEEQYHDGKRTMRKTYSDFIQVAGLWWPQQIETFDDSDRRTSLIRQTFLHLATDQATQRIEEELLQAGYDRAILVPQPLPRLRAARRAVASGKATIPDQFALLLHDSASQQWDRVTDHLDSIKVLASGKTGMRWVEAAILRARRNNEELRKWILHEAQERAADRMPNQPEHGSRSSNYYLAQYLIQQASGVLNSQEMLTLLGRLRPIYARQPDYTEAMKHWMFQQANCLQQVDRPDEALQCWISLANRFPHDANLQQQYANQLAGDGQYEAAYHHLQKTIAQENRWDVHEDDALRNTYVNLLEQEGRWPDMVAYLTDWIARKPSREWPYRYYLSVLVRTEQQEEADALIRQWLQEGRQSKPLEPDVAARIEAAIQHALGNGINVRSSQLDSKWLEPLSATADNFATHTTHMHLANQIMTHQYFRKSDPAKRLREKYAGILKDQIGDLRLAQIERYVDWIWSEDPQPDSAAWKRIVDGLIRRWETETDLNTRQQIAQPLVRILQHRISTDAWLAFLRRQTEDQEDKSAYSRLFEALLSQPWNPDYANELFSIFEKASTAQPETMRPVTAIASLHRLNDYWIKSRFDHLMSQIKDQEKIPRKELLEKRESNLKQAREELSTRLAVEMAKREGPLADWMQVEQLDLEVRLGHELEKVVNACWEKLGAKPTVARTVDDSGFDMDSEQEADIQERRRASVQTWLDAMLQERLLAILSAIAVREDAQPELRTRLLEYVDAGIRISAQEGKAAEIDDRAADPSLGWKQLKHDLLIAWDQPELLEQALCDWSTEQADAAVWKLSLGYLLAERGKVREAIRIWEPLEAEGLLGPDQYRTLAAWYQTVDRREDTRRAKIEIYKTTEEWQLLNTISSALQPWQRSDQTLPSTLDDETLLLFAALIEKSNQPQNYLWQLRSFYTATRDFRLLACLADAVVGQTAGKIYPLLEQLHLVLAEVRDEATADSIVEHIAKLRTCAKTPIDHRALDLLDMLVERRAAELIDQPGPHGKRALDAMRRAYQHPWTRGERQLMAQLLASLGRITESTLADEQLRQLHELHEKAPKGSLERLRIAHHLGRTLAAYAKYDEAIQLVSSALGEYLTKLEGPLPRYANDVLEGLVSHFQAQNHYAEAEDLLATHIEQAQSLTQKRWLREQLFQVYQEAMKHDGRVSIGDGAAIFEPLERLLLEDLKAADHNYRYHLVVRLCTLYRAAHDRKIPGTSDALRRFVYDRLLEALQLQTNNYESIVQTVSQTMHDIMGPADGIRCLVTCIEREPQWLRWTDYNGWDRHVYQLASWREEAETIDDALKERLLAIVTDELRRDLSARNSRNRMMYHQHHGYFWKSETDAFARVAEEVYQEHQQSGTSVAYVAEYLFHGLSRYDRAIEILQAANQLNLLNESERWQLVNFLQQKDRYAESLPILIDLTAGNRANLEYRCALMQAYFQTGQQEPLETLWKETDGFFHEEGRFNENVAARLAKACLDTRLYEPSVSYYEEAIALRQKGNPRHPGGDETLSRYYRELARAYSGLKNTAKAVDAACGAIVCWSARQDQRTEALNTLDDVLREADDLDAYVALLDKETQDSGLDKPIVRKALGKVYLEHQAFAKAAAQLTLAIQSQPNDRTTHEILIECIDKQKDTAGAVQQLLALTQLARRDIQLYQNIGDRLKKDQPAEAERAYTSIVEMLPNESESHALLAEIRQQNDRWHDAAVHWQRVADIRSLEPTGLIQLATTQIHLQQWQDARATLKKIQSRDWPSRFGNVDATVEQLLRQIPAAVDK